MDEIWIVDSKELLLVFQAIMVLWLYILEMYTEICICRQYNMMLGICFKIIRRKGRKVNEVLDKINREFIIVESE